MREKTYTVFAGVNGAGKSTLYRVCNYNKSELRINPDEIVQSFGDWRSQTDQMKAARIAVKKIKDCIEKGVSFNQETTLAGKTMERSIVKAKEQGFRIKVNYVGVANPEIAKERVKQRVMKGGHDIPENLIEKRYYESLENLKRIIPLCDQIQIYDNTNKLVLAAQIKENQLVSVPDIQKAPWIKEIVKDLELTSANDKMQTNEEQIKKELQKAGYKPTKQLIEDMKQVNVVFQQSHSVKEVRDLYKRSEGMSAEKKELLHQTAKNFIQQEQMEIAKRPSVNQPEL